MIDVLGRAVLGYRADGRSVFLIGGGADDPAPAADPAAAPAAPVATTPASGAAGDSAQPAAGDSADELDFSEENFNGVIEKYNAAQKALAEREAAIEAEREEWREKVQRHSRDAAAERVKVRTLSGLISEGATGKPGPKKDAAKNVAAAVAGASEADSRLAELSAQLEETRRDGLLLGARAALAEAGVPKAAVAKAVRLIDLDALERRGAGEIGGLDEQIADLKETMPQLFAPPVAALPPAAPAPNGTAGGARVLRAAPAVAGRGAAGRGGEAPRELTFAEKLANRLNYGNDEGAQG